MDGSSKPRGSSTIGHALNGIFGKIIINNREVAEIVLCNIKIVITRESFCMSGCSVINSRLKNTQGVGSFKIMRVWDRFFAHKLMLQGGIDAPFSMRIRIEDPDMSTYINEKSNSKRPVMQDYSEFIIPMCYFTGDNPVANWHFVDYVSEVYSFIFDDSLIIPIKKILDPNIEMEDGIYTGINTDNMSDVIDKSAKAFPGY